jgi:hypothetical protein
LAQLLAHSGHPINGSHCTNKVPWGQSESKKRGTHIQIIMTQHGN